MLCIMRIFDRSVHIGYSYDRKDRHHHFLCNKVMILSYFHNDNLYVIICRNSQLIKNVFCTLTYKRSLWTTLFVCYQRIQAFNRLHIPDLVSSVQLHILDQVIADRINCKYFLLRDTRYVIIKAAAVHNVLCCLFDICGLIDYDRRISCSCSDCFLSGGKYLLYDCRTTGRYQKTNARMIDHSVGVLNGRLLYHGDQVCRCSSIHQRLV